MDSNFNSQNDSNSTDSYTYAEPVTTNDNNSSSDVLGLIGMICGIVACVCIICCKPIGILTGIAALVLGLVSKSKNNGQFTGKAKAAFICGIIALALIVVLSILGTILGIGSSLLSTIPAFADAMNGSSYYY